MSLYNTHIERLANLQSVFGFDASQVQQGSKEWHLLKLGILSASKADCIVAGKETAKRQEYMASLINQICTMHIEEEKQFKQLEHGKKYEGPARDLLSVELGFVDIKEIPFMYMDESLRVGVSPDGIFDNTIIELKSPFDGTNYFRFMLFEHNKKEWALQCQFQLYATKADRHVFAMYEPRAKLCSPLCMSETVKDDKEQERLANAIPEFIADMDKALGKLGVKFGDHFAYLKSLRAGE